MDLQCASDSIANQNSFRSSPGRLSQSSGSGVVFGDNLIPSRSLLFARTESVPASTLKPRRCTGVRTDRFLVPLSRLVPPSGNASNGVDTFRAAMPWIIGERAVWQPPARTAFTKSPAPGVVQNSVQNPLQRYRIQLKSWKLSEPNRSTSNSANPFHQTT